MFRPVVVSQSTGGLPVSATVVGGWGATEAAGTTGESTGCADSMPAIRLKAHSAALGGGVTARHNGWFDRLCGLDAGDSTQGPLSVAAQRGIVCGRSERLPRRLRLRPDASQRPGREDAHIEELIPPRASSSCGTADTAAGPMPASASHAAHRTPGSGSPTALASSVVAAAAFGPMDANASAA